MVAVPAAAQGNAQPAKPAEMDATYNTLADGILALKNTEANLVRWIILAAYARAQVQLDRARPGKSQDHAVLMMGRSLPGVGMNF